MNKDKFLSLLVGEHDWPWEDIPDHLSNPLPVIRYMEKEMPEVWERYLDKMIEKISFCHVSANKICIEIFKAQLDLNNFILYLSENREWGVKECEQCKGYGERGITHWHTCEVCNGTGIIKHPALIYLEGCDVG